MLQVFVFIGLFLFSCFGVAAPTAPLYQIDMIVFTHLQLPSTSKNNTAVTVLAPDITNAIPLVTTASSAKTAFHALPTSASQLRDEYWALNRKPQYQLLFRHSWLQPANNQRPVALSQMNMGGWNVEGTFKVQKSNYYLLNTTLLFSAPNSKQPAFIFSQKQRLKPDVVYYLDHPQAGMLIKIHPLS